MKLSNLFRVRSLRRFHRYLGLLVGVQLLFWTVSGLYFAWNPLAKVRGEHLANEPATLADLTVDFSSLVMPQVAVEAIKATERNVEVHALALRPLLGEPVYEIHFQGSGRDGVALVDALTGKRRGQVTAEEAQTLAEADFAAVVPVRAVERVESSAPGGEYRSGPLPAWRVDFEHPSGTRIYVAADSGRITARRNDTWRVFDFLWMFHILDFEARNDFNHWLLRGMSVLGLITVGSGFALFVATSGPMMRRRARAHREDGSRMAGY